MQGRNWLILIVASIVISAAVVFGILAASGRIPFARSSPPEATPTPHAPLADATATRPAGPAPTPEDQEPSESVAPADFVHVVEAGDTLSWGSPRGTASSSTG